MIRDSLLFLLIAFVTSTFPQWETQYSGVSASLRDVYFIDSLYGWAVGDSGIIIATSDGGKNWNNIYTLSDTVELKQVQFIDRKIGFVKGNVIKKYPTYESHKVILLRTKDGGFNWERWDFSFDSSFSLGNISFLNSDTGWVSLNKTGQQSWNDRGGVLLKTTNGGSSWSILDEKKLLLNGAFVFVNNQQAYSFWSPFFDNFDNTDVYATSNGGETWNWVGTIKEELVKNAKYITADILWTIGFKTSLSRNGGKDWESWNWFSPVVEGQKRFIPTDIELLDSNNVYFVGDAMSSPYDIEGRLLKTNDSGKNWWIDLQLPNYSFSALSIVNGKEAWIVGSNGLIMHTNDILTDVNSKEEELPKSFNLRQNFPNPFNPSTKIEFSLTQATGVTLEIFDLLGRKVKTLLNSYIEGGLHSIVWDGTNEDGSLMPSSMYIYRLTAGTLHESKKMMLIH